MIVIRFYSWQQATVVSQALVDFNIWRLFNTASAFNSKSTIVTNNSFAQTDDDQIQMTAVMLSGH